MPSTGPTSPAIAAVGGTGLALTATVTGLRQAATWGDEPSAIGVLTLDDLHEGQVELAAAMVLTLVAAVLWGRLHRLPTRRHLLLFTALGVLALDNAVSALFTAGFDSLSSSRFATWSTEGLGLLGVLTLLLAAWLPDEILDDPRRATRRSVLGAGGAVVTVLALAWVTRDSLPSAFETTPTTPADLTLFDGHPVLLAGDLAAAAALAAATVMFARWARIAPSVTLAGWLGMACALLAISSLNYALVPTQYVELLYLGDYFFLAAAGVLLWGAVREIGAAEEARVDAALHSERRRIAREMHDGVTQELAYIANQARTLTSPSAGDGHVGRTADRIKEAAERALDQSRGAITELSGPIDETLAAAIGIAADVVGHRAGARVDLSMDETLVAPPAVRAALVAITRAVVGHATRSAGAAQVRVELWQEGSVHLRITSDGDGPDVDGDGSTVMTMVRERAAGVDGRVIMGSGDGVGMQLEVQVP